MLLYFIFRYCLPCISVSSFILYILYLFVDLWLQYPPACKEMAFCVVVKWSIYLVLWDWFLLAFGIYGRFSLSPVYCCSYVQVINLVVAFFFSIFFWIYVSVLYVPPPSSTYLSHLHLVSCVLILWCTCLFTSGGNKQLRILTFKKYKRDNRYTTNYTRSKKAQDRRLIQKCSKNETPWMWRYTIN